MSPKLKPLLLPQLVEEREQRQKMEIQHIETDGDRQYVYYTHDSSSSDIGSPITPTFSTRGHLRCSSSASSLDLPPNLVESPGSPPAPTSAPISAPPSHKSSSKRQLPDVQEEPMERDDDDTTLSDQFDLYNCLCDEPCVHRDNGMIMSPYDAYVHDGVDYDSGFMSDPDFADQRMSRKQKADYTGFVTRFETKFASLSRWTSARRSQSQTHSRLTSPSTEFGLEHAISSPASHTASSRSSSVSAPSRQVLDRANEPYVTPDPSHSFWDSMESVASSPVDEEAPEERSSLERERALATTPLLPPLMTKFPSNGPQESPLQSPTIAPTTASPGFSPQVPHHTHAPALSAKPSISSFRGFQDQQQQPAPIPGFIQEHDEWSDRLGHANFTITPHPYQPADASLESLHQLCADWETARANFTRHIVRTGEHYGQTSKIYALTEAKWAEIDREWRSSHEEAMKRVPDLSSKTDDALPSFVPVSSSRQTSNTGATSRSRSRGRGRADSASVGAMPAAPSGMTAAMIPRLADAEGKFPCRGDEDIVGPMERAEVMVRTSSEDSKGRFWRSLADRMGLKK